MTARIPTPPAPRRRHSLARSTALLVVLAFAGGGCSLTAKHPGYEDATASIPVDYRQRHPIAVAEGDRALEVFVGARRGGLTPTQRAEVSALAGTWRREATGGFVIEVPAGTPNARAAGEAAREIRSVLAAVGVPAGAIAERRYRPDDPQQLATVTVRYPRMVARTGPCGLWPDDLGLTYDANPMDNRPHWNHGCATQRNLAAMVAEPADLVQPRAETPISTSRRTTVLERYRAGVDTAGGPLPPIGAGGRP